MRVIEAIVRDIGEFSRRLLPEHALRGYQLEVARAVLSLVAGKQGGKAVAVFSRQSGKDEMLAQTLAFLLFTRQRRGGRIVVVLPSHQQANISFNRLVNRLENIALLQGRFRATGREVKLGNASVRFMSGAASAQVRGETADLLLVANEAQDIAPEIWDARFDPMGASTNSPSLFMGTPWTSRTLLAREMKEAQRQQRLYVVDWRRVAQDVPPYGERVRQRIAQFGERHPFVQTEYECHELEGEGGLFPASRCALMRGSHARRESALPGCEYALLVDVAGSDETAARGEENANRHRDSTAITVVEVESGEGLPLYRVVNRYLWQNVPLQAQADRLVGLARETWQARFVVLDATGIGAGLASSLRARLGRKVLPFVFSLKSKSDLGWQWLGLVESGRYFEYAEDGAEETRLFWEQLAAVEFEVLDGPGRMLRWSVPDPTLHDDLVMSAALVATLEEQDWRRKLARSLTE
jgi:hypothetical protein